MYNKDTIMKLYREEKYNEVIGLCEQLISNNQDSWLYLYKAHSLANLKKHNEALEAYEFSITIDPSCASSWNGKGLELHALGLYDEAISAFDIATTLDNKLAAPWNNKANTYFMLRKFDNALESYNQAIELEGNESGHWNNKGNILCELTRYKEALDSYKKAIEIDGNDDYAWNGMGIALRHLDRHNESLEAFKHAIAINQNNATPWNSMGNVLNHLHKYEEAISAFDQASSLDPSLAWPWGGKSTANLHLGLFTQFEICTRRFCALLKADELFKTHSELIKILTNQIRSPLLIIRLTAEYPLLLTSSQWIEAYRVALDECKVALTLEAFLNSPLNNQSEFERLLIKGLLNYLYGDAQMADKIFTSLVKIDTSSLLVHYYLLQSRSDYFEPADQASIHALENAKAALGDEQADLKNLYYAGLIFSMLGHNELAQVAFAKANDFLPAMYLRAMILDDLASGEDVSSEAQKVLEEDRDACLRAILEKERINVKFGRPLLAGNPLARINFMIDVSWARQVVEFAHAHEIANAANLLEEFFERHPEEDYGLASSKDPSIPWSTTWENTEYGLQLASDSLEHFVNDFARDIRKNTEQTRNILVDEEFSLPDLESMAPDNLEKALAALIDEQAGEADTEERLMRLIGYFMCLTSLTIPTGLLLRFYLAASCSKDTPTAESLFQRTITDIAGVLASGLLSVRYGVLAGSVAGSMVANISRSLFEFYKKHPSKPKNYHEFKKNYLNFAKELGLSADLWR